MPRCPDCNVYIAPGDLGCDCWVRFAEAEDERKREESENMTKKTKTDDSEKAAFIDRAFPDEKSQAPAPKTTWTVEELTTRDEPAWAPFPKTRDQAAMDAYDAAEKSRTSFRKAKAELDDEIAVARYVARKRALLGAFLYDGYASEVGSPTISGFMPPTDPRVIAYRKTLVEMLEVDMEANKSVNTALAAAEKRLEVLKLLAQDVKMRGGSIEFKTNGRDF